MAERSARSTRDLLSRPAMVIAGYAIPVTVLLVAGMIDLSKATNAAIWALSMLVMGVTCAANAKRCGRVHCYFTAPSLFAMAGITLLFGFDVRGFTWLTFDRLGSALAVGTALLWLGSEMVFGRYFSGPHRNDG